MLASCTFAAALRHSRRPLHPESDLHGSRASSASASTRAVSHRVYPCSSTTLASTSSFIPSILTSTVRVAHHTSHPIVLIKERQKHFYATYQVVSTLPITLHEYVSQISEAMGKEFEIKKIPLEQAAEMFTKMTYGDGEEIGQEYIDAPERMLLYYNRRGLYGNPGVLEWLIGRKATAPGELAGLKLQGRA